MTRPPDETQRPAIPWPALVVAAVGVIACSVASVLAWPDMADSVVTREAGVGRGESVVSRPVGAVAMPATIGLLAVGLAYAPSLDDRLRRLLRLRPANLRGNTARVMGATISALTLLMTVLHLGLLAMFTDRDFPLEQAMAMGVGLLAVVLGVVLPLTRPESQSSIRWLRTLSDAAGPAYRPAGYLLCGAGLAAMAVAFPAPQVALTIATIALVAAFVAPLVVGVVRASRT